MSDGYPDHGRYCRSGRRPAACHYRVDPADPVPVRARHRPRRAGRPGPAAGNRLQDVHLPRCAGNVGAVHCHFLGGFDRLDPGIRFLRGMLVAPGSRGAIVIGKCLGGATIATFQGIIFLILAGFAHVPYNPILIIVLIGELLLLSFTLTAFGVMMAARIKQFQAFMALTQMLVMPLFFLSGALYPLSGLPAWLSVLTRIDPLTYVVGPMRHAVFSHLSIAAPFEQRLAPGITWN